MTNTSQFGADQLDRELRRRIPHGESAVAPPHAIALDALFERLRAQAAGLGDDEAQRRLLQYGLNRLTPPAPVSALAIVRSQLRSVVVALLVGAAVIALILGDSIEAAAIAAVLVINTAIGFTTEFRARRAMAALLELDVPRAVVLRGGHLRAVDAHVLVPGDVIQIDAGQDVPADARIVEATDLRVNEAPLTGESLPVSKRSGVLPDATPLADRSNMVYKSTTVAAGTARAIVTATGAATEVGRIGVLVGGVIPEPTPLERRLDELGRRLVWFTVGIAALVSGLGTLQGVPLGLVIETGIALAVAAVPEALPAVATIALAVGVHRMARRHALVRRLPAVESLGSTTVVCTDKTRTLTSGEMTVVRIWADGVEFDPTEPHQPVPAAADRLLRIGARASRVQAARHDGGVSPGDPVDAALLRAADRLPGSAADTRAPLGLVPFSSTRKFMAVFHDGAGGVIASVKGAPATVLALCSRTAGGAPLDEHARTSLMAVNDRLARAGLRVLAIAGGAVADRQEAAVRDLAFAGFAGLMDPPAGGVRETIARLTQAGLRTVMVTGDQRLTAEAIGRVLGLLSDDAEVLEGSELDALSARELAARVPAIAAFSRITPEHKLAIVSALQSRGEIVAMLGDGVNDAPALRKADVGVAMGRRGTDAAKQAAAIVLQDDRFETIAAAVEEGRVIFDNIRKFVFYLFSCNVGEILVLLGGSLAGWPTLLAPMQLLWLNMVTDTFPALALATEPAERDVMHRPPRDPGEAILSRAFLLGIVLYGGLIMASTLMAYAWALRTSPHAAQTMAFMTLAFAQTLHLGNARSASAVIAPRQIVSNPLALAAVSTSLALQIGASSIPALAAVLHVKPLTVEQWLVVVGCSLVPACAGQVLKIAGGRRPAPRRIPRS